MSKTKGKKKQKTGFRELPSIVPNEIALQCGCGNVLHKRRDSFLPGAHVAICVVCGQTSTEITLLDGSTVRVGAEAHRGSSS